MCPGRRLLAGRTREPHSDGLGPARAAAGRLLRIQALARLVRLLLGTPAAPAPQLRVRVGGWAARARRPGRPHQGGQHLGGAQRGAVGAQGLRSRGARGGAEGRGGARGWPAGCSCGAGRGRPSHAAGRPASQPAGRPRAHPQRVLHPSQQLVQAGGGEAGDQRVKVHAGRGGVRERERAGRGGAGRGGAGRGSGVMDWRMKVGGAGGGHPWARAPGRRGAAASTASSAAAAGRAGGGSRGCAPLGAGRHALEAQLALQRAQPLQPAGGVGAAGCPA